jgi:hypothetical protein
LDPVANLSHVERSAREAFQMRTPMKARHAVTVKTVLAGLGIALLSACSGNPTGPSAPAQGRSSTIVPVGRSNFTGYVVAARDTLGLIPMTQTLTRRIPPADPLPLGPLQ